MFSALDKTSTVQRGDEEDDDNSKPSSRFQIESFFFFFGETAGDRQLMKLAAQTFPGAKIGISSAEKSLMKDKYAKGQVPNGMITRY